MSNSTFRSHVEDGAFLIGLRWPHVFIVAVGQRAHTGAYMQTGQWYESFRHLCLRIQALFIIHCKVHDIDVCVCARACVCGGAWVGIWNWLLAVTQPTQQTMFILIRYAKDRRMKRVSVKAARVGTRRPIDRWGNAGVGDRLKSESHTHIKMEQNERRGWEDRGEVINGGVPWMRGWRTGQ